MSGFTALVFVSNFIYLAIRLAVMNRHKKLPSTRASLHPWGSASTRASCFFPLASDTSTSQTEKQTYSREQKNTFVLERALTILSNYMEPWSHLSPFAATLSAQQAMTPCSFTNAHMAPEGAPANCVQVPGAVDAS